MALGYSPVQRAQESIARTLSGGLSDLGNRPLQKARFGLEEAQIRHGLARQDMLNARQKAAWDAGASARELSQLTSKRGIGDIEAQNQLRNKELDAGFFGQLVFGPNPSQETLSQFFANGIPQKIMAATGGSFKDGKFIKADGKVATGADLPVLMPIMKDIFQLTADPGHRLNQRIGEYEERFMSSRGEEAATPEQVRLYEQALKNKGDRNWIIGQYQKQNERAIRQEAYYRKMGMGKAADILKETVARRDRKIAKQQGALAEDSKRAFELKKLDIQEKGKDRKAGVKQKYSDKINQLKYEAQSAYLNGIATKEQIRMYQLDKDVHLAQATKLVNDSLEFSNLEPKQKIEKIIEFADELRKAATSDTEQPVVAPPPPEGFTID